MFTASGFGVCTGARMKCILAGLHISSVLACSKAPTAPSAQTPTTVPVSGTVWDSATRPVAGARVAVTTGPDAGRFATTGGDGRYALSGTTLASGDLTLEASKEGFFSQSVTLNGRNHLPNDIGYTFTLVPVALLDLAGEHTLTIAADPLCDLPPVARVRTYHASAAPRTATRTNFVIGLGGASFFQRDNSLNALVAADFARFIVYSANSFDDEPVVESLGSDAYVAFMGAATADAARTDRVITARFDGSILFCPATPSTTYFNCPVAPAVCRSSFHRLILTRE
jgi:hypothetical protein